MSDSITHASSPSSAQVRSPQSRVQAGISELAQITAWLTRIGEGFSDAITESTNETAMWRARVAQLEARPSTEDNHAARSRQNNAELKLKLVRRTMTRLLEQLGPDDGTLSAVHSPRLSHLSPAVGCTSSPARTPRSVHAEVSKIAPSSVSSWRMSTTRMPMSAVVVCPISWADLGKSLSLGDDTLCSLESLVRMDDLCFRVQIIRDMAFIYNPVTMDCTSISVLFDWGSPADNQGTAEYLQPTLSISNVLHTFILHSNARSSQTLWYYIGAHAWVPVPSLPIWQAMGDKAKRMLVDRLKERCCGRYSDNDISRMIESGQLAPFCVEMSSKSCVAVSRTFAAERLGYRNPKLNARQS